MSVLTGGEQVLTTLFTPLSAYSFLSFVLLYMPCIAAVATTKRELGGKNAVLTIIYQTLAAWVVAFIIFQAGSLFLGG